LFSLIGREIENPFGSDVNDLPLEAFCNQIQSDISIIMSRPAPKPADFLNSAENEPLYPLSHLSTAGWMDKSVDEIREALSSKLKLGGLHTESDEVRMVKSSEGRRSEAMERKSESKVRRRDVETGGVHGE
jgi:putative membrane protein